MKSSFFERLISKKKRLKRLKKKVIDYLSNLPQDKLPEDKRLVLEFLKSHDISVFPYPFTNKYKASDIELFLDENLKLYYMLWEGKKLYYRSGSRKKKAQKYFNSLLLEQDTSSPHRYLTEDFRVEENDIVIDAGAAEGNFSLSVIEKAGHVYLFEPDKKWIQALQATFGPWSHKVTIVPKFIADKSDEKSIRLDDYFQEGQPINFIKADVEGQEAQMLRGSSVIMKQHKNLKIAVCTYHNQEDADVLDLLLKESGFDNKFSNGYMLYYYGRSNVVREPYLRKAVLRAVKNSRE